MKKNLISILILALLVVNVVLTAIMMFSVTGSAKKTATLVTDISTALNLELTKGESGGEENAIHTTDLVSVDIPDTLTIPLAVGEDGKAHYCLLGVTFFLNSKSEDYETMSQVFAANTSLNKSVVISVVGEFTLESAQADKNALKDAILKAIQSEYNSDFVHRVEFSNIMFQ